MDFHGLFGHDFLTSAVFLVSLCLYMPAQVVSISSRHLSVSLNIPEKSTKLYLTKFYFAKTILNFIGSSLMLLLQRVSTSLALEIISILTCSALCILRILSLLAFLFSKNAAIDYYYIMSAASFVLGMFITVFYSLIPDHMSVLSIAFKVSRLIIWVLQIILDITVIKHPKLMITIHMICYNLMTIAGVCMWNYHFTTKRNKEEKEQKVAKTNSENTSQHPTSGVRLRRRDLQSLNTFLERTLGYKGRGVHKPVICEEVCPRDPVKTDDGDYTVSQHVYRAISPILLCIVGWSTRGFFMPGIIPYSLLPRDKCHFINISLLPFPLLGAVAIHYVKEHYKTHRLGQPWTDGFWNCSWLLYLPPLIIAYYVSRAIHYEDTRAHSLLHNNVPVVVTLAIIFYTCLSLMESIGYPGVSGNVKVYDEDKKAYKHKPNGLFVVSFNALLSQFIVSIAYKLSSGYLLARTESLQTFPNWTPTYGMNKVEALFYWIKSTFVLAYEDFLQEFDGNIKDFV